jgi:ribosomal protein S13
MFSKIKNLFFKKKPVVFALVGYRGCGKDYIFKELLRHNGKFETKLDKLSDTDIDLINDGVLNRFAISDNLKRFVKDIFGFTDSQIEKYKRKSENKIKFDIGARRLNMRQILVLLANTVREYSNKDFWVLKVIKNINTELEKNKTIKIIPVITDLRFMEEYEVLKKNFNLKVIRIYGINCPDCENNSQKNENKDEYDIENIPYDYFINNYCKDKERFQDELNNLIKFIKEEIHV